MTRVSATDDGRATAEMAQYYQRFADGGFSYLSTEGTYPDEAHSQGYLNQPGLATDTRQRLATVPETVHEAGVPIFAQLMHAGAQSQGTAFRGLRVPSFVTLPKSEYERSAARVRR